jgi:hypothetical protein
MPKQKPTHDDLVSALYDIWMIIDEITSEEETETTKKIRTICENILPD